MRNVSLSSLLILASLAASLPRYGVAQTLPATEPLIDMSFPDDGIELSLLADIVTRKLHVPILYDEQVRGKKVIIRVPAKVPQSALMGILQSALRTKQLALVDAEQPGWKQIVPAPNLAAVAVPGNAKNADSPVAQLFVLQHADANKVAEMVRPFLTSPGGYVQAESGQKSLIVGDYPSVVRRVELLIKDLDAQAPPVETRFVSLKSATPTALVASVQQLISNRETYQWGSTGASGIFLTPDDAGNQVVVVAPPNRMDEIVSLINGLDRTPELESRVYHLKSISPQRVDEIARGLLEPSLLKRGYQTQSDDASQTYVVSAVPAAHARLATLIEQLDVPMPAASNPIQFYKLKNSKAADLLATINGLLGDAPTSQPSVAEPAVTPPTPTQMSGYRPLGGSFSGDDPFASAGGSNFRGDNNRFGGFSNSSVQQAGVLAVHGHGATAMADVNTNSIIVSGPPSVQQMYGDLIQKLDQRRPQVQVECTIVTLDTTDNNSFGVDIGHLGGSDNQILTLSSFGVSSVNPQTGRLTPTGGTGGSFALLSPRIADVVVRALATNTRARLLSAPRLLVNDNGQGQLKSVAQQPFSVISTNANTALQSQGGLAEAGTTIQVEPHISEADYLQLEYSIELSNFTGDASDGLSPPKQENSIESGVTIPDGYTIVVGGLNSSNYTTAVSSIPILGQIPVIKYLFGARNSRRQDTTLFVFIRPTILRDDQFEDLKYLSANDLSAAGLFDRVPRSDPVLMK